MKIRLLVFVFFMVFSYSYSQNKNGNSNYKLYKEYISKGDSLVKIKDYNKSIEFYTLALQLKIETANTLYKRGLSYFRNMDNEKAILDFTDLLGLGDKNGGAYFFRALSKFNLDKTESACEDLLKAKQLGYQMDFENYKIVCPNL